VSGDQGPRRRNTSGGSARACRTQDRACHTHFATLYRRCLSLKTLRQTPVIDLDPSRLRSGSVFPASGRPLLRTRHDNSMAPSLPRHYPGSSRLWTTPTSDVRQARLCLPLPAFGLRSPARRISQVPDQSVAARRPRSPRQAAPVLTLILPGACRLQLLWQPGHLRLAFRGRSRFNLLRLTAHRFAVHASRRFARVPSQNRPRSPRCVTST